MNEWRPKHWIFFETLIMKPIVKMFGISGLISSGKYSCRIWFNSIRTIVYGFLLQKIHFYYKNTKTSREKHWTYSWLNATLPTCSCILKTVQVKYRPGGSPEQTVAKNKTFGIQRAQTYLNKYRLHAWNKIFGVVFDIKNNCAQRFELYTCKWEEMAGYRVSFVGKER